MDINDLMPNGFDAAHQPDPPPPEKKPPMPPGCPGNCMITPEPVFQATKKGTGYFLKVEMIVLAGPYAGRKLWDRLNVSNPNPRAEQISKSQLKKLCLAAGIAHLQSKAELTGKIVRPTIKVDGLYNVVTGYAVADMAELAAAQQTAVDAVNTSAPTPVAQVPVAQVPVAAPIPFPVPAAQQQIPFEGVAGEPTPSDYLNAASSPGVSGVPF